MTELAAPLCKESYPVRQAIADVLSIVRLHAACWFALLGLLGATIAENVDWAHLAELSGYAIALSSMGFTVNNIADRGRDSHDPRRVRAPLVAGRISVHGALVIAATCELVALAAVVLPTVSAASRSLALALSFLMIVGNAYQKSLGRFAVIADVVFGIGMGLEVVLGHLWVADGVSRTVLLLAFAVGVQMTVLNITTGNLKDLSADLISPQTTTTAIAFGVRSSPLGGLIMPIRYRALVLTLQLVSLGLVVAVGLAGPRPEFWGIGRACLVALGIASSIAATYGVYRLVRGRHRLASRGRDWYLFVNFAALLLTYAASASGRVGLLVGSAFAAALAWEASWMRIAARITPPTTGRFDEARS